MFPHFGPRMAPGLRGGMQNFGSGRGRHRNPWFIVLGLQLVQKIVDLPRKPPLTLALMAGMTALHLAPEVVNNFLGTGPAVGGLGGFLAESYRRWVSNGYSNHIQELCLLPASMLEAYQRTGALGFRRFFLSAFLHGSERHLYYNMWSFLLKGVSLELDMGTRAYFGLLAFCLVTSQALFLVASWIMLVVFEQPSAMYACTVGFSGVIFALKYVLNRRSPAYTRVMGFKIHTRYAAWLELVLIQFMVPNASFLGHLCGIFAGILYVEVPAVASALNLVAVSVFGNPRPSYTYSSGSTGSRAPTSARDGDMRRHGSGSASGIARRVQTAHSSAFAGDEAEEAAFQEALRRSMLDTGPRGANGAGSTRGEQGRMGHGGDTPITNVESYRVTPSAPSEEVEWSVESEGGTGIGTAELRRRRLQRMSIDL